MSNTWHKLHFSKQDWKRVQSKTTSLKHPKCTPQVYPQVYPKVYPQDFFNAWSTRKNSKSYKTFFAKLRTPEDKPRGQISNIAKCSFDIFNAEIAQCCQKLDVILITNRFQNWSNQKMYFSKNVVLNWYSSMTKWKKKMERLRLFLT